jgi:hypothetical protein
MLRLYSCVLNPTEKRYIWSSSSSLMNPYSRSHAQHGNALREALPQAMHSLPLARNEKPASSKGFQLKLTRMRLAVPLPDCFLYSMQMRIAKYNAAIPRCE